MFIGQKIRNVRRFRGMTQKELGVKLGFSKENADVRIAQYESGRRSPKKELKKKISNILRINQKFLVNHSVNCVTDVIFTLFDIDDIYGLAISTTDGKPYITFNEKISEHLLQWKNMKEKLADNEITESEYLDWKYNFIGE